MKSFQCLLATVPRHLGRAIDTRALVRHFGNVKSLQEIEEAIAKLPAKARRQLVKDVPALCPDEFPSDGWDSILRDETPRPGFSSLLDSLDSEYEDVEMMTANR